MLQAYELPSIASLIETRSLRTFFQPIVSVRMKRVAGVEALLRGVHPDTGEFISPKDLFDAAIIQEKSHVLDRAAMKLSLTEYARRGLTDQLLFVNVDLDTMQAEGRTDELLRHIGALNIAPGSIVIELVENQCEDQDRLHNFVARVREHGVLLAVDDIGAGHSNLERISLIRPDILKIDRSLCSKLGSDRCTEEVFSALVNLGRRIGSLVVAEGIETRAQAMVALERGADLLQGYLILKPQPSESIDLQQAHQATSQLAGHFRQHMTQAINHSKIERRMHNILLDTVLCELAQAEQNAFAGTVAQTVRSHPDIECAYILDQRGQQVTDTIFNAHEAPPTSLMFRPADVGADHSLKEYYHNVLDQEATRYVTAPYVSLASGHMCRTLSAMFRDGTNEKMFVLCVDVKAA